MRMRSQLLLAQLPIAAIIFILSLSFASVLVLIKQKSDHLLIDNFKSIVTLQKLNDSLEELHTLKPPHSKSLENTIEQQLIIQEAIPQESVDADDLTKSLRQKWNAYKENTQGLASLYKEIRHVIASLVGLNQDALMRKKENFSNFISHFLMVIIFGSIAIVIFGFSISWFLTGLFLSPLNKMTDAMSQLGKTDKTTILYIKGSDELESLSREFNLMTHRLEEYHQSSLGQVMQELKRFQSAFDSLPDPILILNQSNEILYSNGAARLFIESNEGAREVFTKLVRKVQLTKAPYVADKADESLSLQKDDHRKTFFLPSAYPLRNINGEDAQDIDCILIVLQDFMRESLSGAGTTDVYEKLIHEFQSSLTTIHMAIHTCTQESAGPLTEKQQEILYGAREKCDQLETLCQDLLHLSQVTQTNRKTEPREIHLNVLLSKIITSLQLDSYQKGLFIECEEPPYLNPIHADSNQVEILIGNLMRNAIHHADPGTSIKIKISEKNNFIQFSIHNKGPFIPAQYHKNIFKKYFKAPGSPQNSAGLGLYIAKQIVDSLGGKIGFKSTAAHGTTFWVDLPIAAPNASKM